MADQKPDLNQLLGGAPDSLSPEVLNRLADLVVAKLTAQNEGRLTLNQQVQSSSLWRLTT